MQNTIENFSYSEFDLPFSISSAMDYESDIYQQVGDKLVLGYLSDDDDCENPLKNSDGMGEIYSAHRFSDKHSEMQEALGLDSSWEPNLDLVDDFETRLRRIWIDMAVKSSEFSEWAIEHTNREVDPTEKYLRYRAEKMWREGYDSDRYSYDRDYFEFTDEAKLQLWKQLKEERLIGDKDVVVLDCYSHSGESWSISGGGMQCRWDTATGAGVWVPDDAAREEIDRRAKPYAFGKLDDWMPKSGTKRYFVKLDEEFGGARSPDFEGWYEAFQWLEEASAKLKLPKAKAKREATINLGRERAAEELASEALVCYNDWLSGACYGIVVATYTNAGEGTDPEWEMDASEECWGFVGSDHAIGSLKEEFNSTVQALQKAA